MAGTLTDQDNSLPQIERPANPQSVAYTVYAPKTNPALQLAESLSNLEPKAGQLAANYSRLQEHKAEEQSKADALKTQGADYAEAVRTGAIEPTQSPWYIQAYQRNAAQVKTMAGVAQLNTDAATWSEQNDPAAFQAKYAKSLAELGKGYTDTDGQEGFNAAAQPAYQQALAQNQAYNVERIKGQRVQDISSLTGNALQKATAARGGRTSVEAVISALAPFKAEWLSTGGTITDWNAKVLPGAITDAAFASGDSSVIDIAKKLQNEGGGSIYDQAGMAKQMEQAAYDIDRQKKYDASMEREAILFRQDQQTRQVEGDLFAKYGPGIYSGRFDAQQAINDLSSKYPAPVLAKAFQSITSTANSIRELAADRTGAYGSSPAGSTQINSLYGEASKDGWSERLETDLGKLLLSQSLSDQTAQDIRSKALATTRSKATAGGGTQAQALNRRQTIIAQWTTARDTASKAASKAEQAYRAAGGAYLSPEDQVALQREVIDSVSDFLEAQPKGFKLVGQVATQAARQWVVSHSQTSVPQPSGSAPK